MANSVSQCLYPFFSPQDRKNVCNPDVNSTPNARMKEKSPSWRLCNACPTPTPRMSAQIEQTDWLCARPVKFDDKNAGRVYCPPAASKTKAGSEQCATPLTQAR